MLPWRLQPPAVHRGALRQLRRGRWVTGSQRGQALAGRSQHLGGCSGKRADVVVALEAQFSAGPAAALPHEPAASPDRLHPSSAAAAIGAPPFTFDQVPSGPPFWLTSTHPRYPHPPSPAQKGAG